MVNIVFVFYVRPWMWIAERFIIICCATKRPIPTLTADFNVIGIALKIASLTFVNDNTIIVDIGINFDERVADGYYFAKSIQLIQYIFDNPELLEEEMFKEIKLEEIR